MNKSKSNGATPQQLSDAEKIESLSKREWKSKPYKLSLVEDVMLTLLMTPLVDPHDPKGPASEACLWGVPFVISGLSGVSKSQRLRQISRALRLLFERVLPSHKQPEDFGGVPMQVQEKLVMECILSQARRLMDQDAGILLIDELTTARPAVQAVALGVFDERCIGDHRLPNKVRVIGAMNPPDYAANGFALEAALANRMAHIQFPAPTAEAWGDWLIGKSVDIPDFDDMEAQVLDKWSEHWSVVRALIQSFIKANPAALHAQPKPEDPRGQGAWESPRTWHAFACALTTARCLGKSEEVQQAIMLSCLGDANEAAWAAWVANNKIPDPRHALMSGWVCDKRRLDVTAAVLTAIRLWLTDLDLAAEKDLVPLVSAAWTLAMNSFDTGLGDQGIVLVEGLMNKHLDCLGKYVKDTPAEPFAQKGALKAYDSGFLNFGR